MRNSLLEILLTGAVLFFFLLCLGGFIELVRILVTDFFPGDDRDV
jgi:hypothetical protein